MRHLDKGRSLSRSPSHRRAVLENLAQELFQHKRIRTTLMKAKELRPFAERLVTTAKRGHLAARRCVLRHLSRRSVVKSLFEEIAPAYANRNGGYTRIIKLGNRIGDNAPMAVVELVGFEGVLTAKLEASDKAAKKAEAEKKAPIKPKKKARTKSGIKAPAKAQAGKKKETAESGGTSSRKAKKSGDR